MKLVKSSQWFELDSPIGEPDITWTYPIYEIERVEWPDKIIWFGQGTNWVKEKDKSWTKLEGIEFVECEEPIYETLYKEMINGNTTS